MAVSILARPDRTGARSVTSKNGFEIGVSILARPDRTGAPRIAKRSRDDEGFQSSPVQIERALRGAIRLSMVEGDVSILARPDRTGAHI